MQDHRQAISRRRRRPRSDYQDQRAVEWLVLTRVEEFGPDAVQSLVDYTLQRGTGWVMVVTNGFRL